MDIRMSTPKQDLSDRRIQHQRKKTKTTQSWACIYCLDKKIFATEESLWEHGKTEHLQELEGREGDLNVFREQFVNQSAQKRPYRRPRPAHLDDREAEECRSPKRAHIEDGISAGSGSSFRDSSSSPYRRSKARPTSGHFDTSGGDGSSLRSPTSKRQLWQGQIGLTKSSFDDPSNLASVAAQKARAAQHAKSWKPSQSPHPSSESPRPQKFPSASTNVDVRATTKPSEQRLNGNETILQPETRIITQEQLVAEVKGIYAGLVMVEAKLIEVDNKQATLAQADPGSQPKLNNEQWQALIALHRTLLHEHHEFFIARQHPSASPALHRLASKYAMPARMWRHGIHSFFELLRHKLPACLDHMLDFIYLAYSMMALLYETVPAFEDTWIECLGDLGHYRMAIEDDDIRDREVWTGVSRHWYSKASDKALTTGRLYHHLAILARPNALQQLLYCAKSLCAVIPITSARESIRTLLDPVLPGEIGPPPPDISLVKARHLFFQNKSTKSSMLTMREHFTRLRSNNARATPKLEARGYSTAYANYITMLCVASKDNVLVKFSSSSRLEQSPTDGISMPSSLSKSPEQCSLHNQLESPPDTSDSHLDQCHDAIQSRDCSCNCTTSGSNIVMDNASLLVYNSGRVSWILRKLQSFLCYIRAVILLNLCEHIGTVAASDAAVTEKSIKRMFQPLLEYAAVELACALAIGVGTAEYLQRYWDIDAWLFLNVFLHAGIPLLAPDTEFSNGEMLVLCGYCAWTNIHWMKKKLRKLSKTGGITALFITALSLYSGWEFAHQIPGLESKFDNKYIPRAIASVPSAAVYSVVWCGAVEQTRLAAAIEAHIDDPRLWQFLLRILRAFLLQFCSRGIQVFLDRFFRRFDDGFQNNPLQRLVQVVEGDPRALWNEPVRAPGSENNLFWEPEDIEEEPREFIPRHDQFRGHRNEHNIFHRPRDMEAYPRAYVPRNEANLGPDEENLYRGERRHSPQSERFDRQQSEDDHDDNVSYRQENQDRLASRGESPPRRY